MPELISENQQGNFIALLLKRQVLLWQRLYFMVKGSSWTEAAGEVSNYWYTKCVRTGKANIMYRPGDPTNNEIGPQLKPEFEEWGKPGYDIWLLVLLILIVLRYVKRGRKK